ncbi:MAG: CocE/NonD family hydrolase [Nitrospirae bacterium]|nr:CocE/NonD family hydrolase [Nitrospirota bacterium]
MSQFFSTPTQDICRSHIYKGFTHFFAIFIFLPLVLGYVIGCSPIARDHTNSESTPSSSSISSDQATSHSWQRTSRYLTMRDGVKVAVDLYLPTNLGLEQQIPTILHQTRYWRAIEYRWLISLFKDDRPRGVIGNYAERFLQQGYAWVDVDVRGSGASFGTRPIAYSPAEIQDGAEIVDWIIAQPWSNGKIGAMGISYSGATAEMLLVNQHPAVRAIAPMFSGFDLYSEIAFPGGIHLNWFTETWSYINNQLDNNELPFAGWMGNLFVRGVLPVDGDTNNHLLTMAVQEHEVNWSPFKEASGLTFRDDPPPSRQAPTIDALSTQTFVREIEQSGAAIYSYSGWFDGGYALAAIKRHLHHHNPENKLILGPWDHGGKRQISPYAIGPAQFDHAKELIRFFDQHLKNVQTETHDEPPIQYYTMGAERWNTSTQWPPPSSSTQLYFHTNNQLSEEHLQKESPPDRYHVDPTAGTGKHSRWNTLVGISLKNPYPDRKEQDKKLVVYTTDPLPEDLEVTGHPVATVYLSANATDTTVFVYLGDVTPEGDVHYVTEGELRALHRKWHPTESTTDSVLSIPNHTFRRADAAPLIHGEVVSLTLDLLPVSYQFKKGHRIRVALAGADKDHFQLLDDPSPTWKIWHTIDRPSHIELPIISISPK